MIALTEIVCLPILSQRVRSRSADAALGWGLAFRGWSSVAIALLPLVPLIPRIHSEERLLRGHFGAEYDAYVKRTWRLIPGIY